MSVPRLNFLVIDHHKDSRFLLVTCLQRKFPDAAIIEGEEGDTAIELARRPDLTAIVTHRTREYFGAELVGKLREANADVPIVMISGIERTAPALAAGADRFLLYDEWLRIGSIVKELLEARAAGASRRSANPGAAARADVKSRGPGSRDPFNRKPPQ